MFRLNFNWNSNPNVQRNSLCHDATMPNDHFLFLVWTQRFRFTPSRRTLTDKLFSCSHWEKVRISRYRGKGEGTNYTIAINFVQQFPVVCHIVAGVAQMEMNSFRVSCIWCFIKVIKKCHVNVHTSSFAYFSGSQATLLLVSLQAF